MVIVTGVFGVAVPEIITPLLFGAGLTDEMVTCAGVYGAVAGWLLRPFTLDVAVALPPIIGTPAFDGTEYVPLEVA
ncbi:MAG: hypothetical protein GY914_09105, partial [Prochlorococcus sp.]|nr:hypothetical protein [Prochlorococcus sp.]